MPCHRLGASEADATHLEDTMTWADLTTDAMLDQQHHISINIAMQAYSASY